MRAILKENLFIMVAVSCVFLLSIATFKDLELSNALINYHSFFGTTFQTFGEFPIYFIFIISGEIALIYAIRCGGHRSFSIPLFIGGFALSAWQVEQYLNEITHYSLAALTNLYNGKPLGMHSNDVAVFSVTPQVKVLLWLGLYSSITIVIFLWMKNKRKEELQKYLLVAVFASLTALLSLEINGVLKAFWGRVRPYELSTSQHNFTSWLQPNGFTGHRSFPSGHTMAATLMVVFSWFTVGKRHTRVLIVGVFYGAIMGIARIIIGAHFLSDVVFSYFLTLLVVFIMHGLYNHIVSDELKLT
ncbi:phosphatase PAP2 family protein [Liquorilactobacillus capillatus]|uniref:Membrane-associated phospholipid phosphatase n=1 Tax=Liquorilactobacillus capillatus DSM 19910 TaxID=1423731 RepID=A0A0R1LWN8_9LACO|nr:phosphatase PAP2 family protein [Liquorilactobacillus capillatus]KRL00157.1 membrane-associated phospholipid phosphatase [Liquorilactobacillus capillatus DSM 19910]